MEELKVKEVDFMGDILIATQDNQGNIWAGVKWVCDGIGLSVGQMQNERLKIQSDLVLNRGASNFVLPTNGGKQEVLCLMLDYVPIWLAKINITPTMKEESPQLVEKLINYQLKVKDILAQAFLPQYQYKQQETNKKQLDLKAITVISKTTKYNMPVVLKAFDSAGYNVDGLDLYIQPHYEVIDSGITDIVNETKEIINELLDKNNFLAQYIATNELCRLLYQKRK